jgi:hypothetical protein
MDVDEAMKVKDLTILYYTANHIPDTFAHNVRKDLAQVIDGRIPVISISQKRINFGSNICIGDIGRCAYNVYFQILIGAELADTEFVACCEDDTLYSWEHFCTRPLVDTFYYNKNRWILEGWGAYRWRNRTTMCGCIAPTKLLVENLRKRFELFPTAESANGIPFGEPGRSEQHLRMELPKLHYFTTDTPIVTFNHDFGLARPRRRNPSDTIVKSLEPWGDAAELWRRIYG